MTQTKSNLPPEKWRCTKCECLWRLNPPSKAQPEGSWSLYDAQQKSCSICDNSPDFLKVIVSVDPEDGRMVKDVDGFLEAYCDYYTGKPDQPNAVRQTTCIGLAQIMSHSTDDDKRVLAREVLALTDRLDAMKRERDEARESLDRALESEMDKLLAMPDERIQAALRLEGRDPKDAATIVEQAAKLAILTVDLKTAEQRAEGLERDAGRYRWLREQSGAAHRDYSRKEQPWRIDLPPVLYFGEVNGPCLDTAIDAALTGESKDG